MEVFEDSIDLHIGLLRTADPTSSSYPYPALEIHGDAEMRTFSTLIFENEFLRTTLIPELGGRLIELFDKRTQTEILQRYPSLEPQIGGRRGAFLREGVQFQYDDDDRLNAMGPVATAFHSIDDSDAGRWIAENVSGTGLSFHVNVGLAPGAAELRFELRVFNRSLRPVPYNGQIVVHMGEGEVYDDGYYASARDCGIVLFAEPGVLTSTTSESGTVAFRRFGNQRFLGPRQVDSFTVRLVPYSGLRGRPATSPAFSVFARVDALAIQSTETRLGHRIAMLTEDGKSYEASVDLYAERILEIPTDGISSAPASVALLNENHEVIQTLSLVSTSSHPSVPHEPLPDDPMPDAPTLHSIRDCRENEHRMDWRALTHLTRARLISRETPLEKLAAYDQSLLFNGDDPLTWWEKAFAKRMSGDASQEIEEILNSHYLAPLEPILRADRFLGASAERGKEADPLLASMAVRGEELVEVACLLIESGYLDQANRWIDEALRHRSFAMLHYLQAFLLLTATRMDTEAARHVGLARETATEPPFPFREIEWRALQDLADRFPADSALSQMLKMGRYMSAP